MKIVRTIFSVILLLLGTSCASEYQIEGNSSVTKLDGKMFVVKIPRDGQMMPIDSAEVIHGLFKMQGEIDSVVIASLYMGDQSIMPLVVEEGKIRIMIDNARVMVSGTPLNDELYRFVGKKNLLEDRAYEVGRMESRMIMEGKPMEEVEREIMQEREKLSKEMDELVKDFVQKNYENVLGPGVFIMLCNNFPYPVLTPLIEEIVEDAPDSFKNDRMVKEYMSAARANMSRWATEK